RCRRGDRRQRRRRRGHREGVRSSRARRSRRGARRSAQSLDSARRRYPSAGRDSVRVALAEDSVLLREGLARLLGEAGFDVVGQCGTADDLLLKVRSYTPDVVIVDVRLALTLLADSAEGVGYLIKDRISDVDDFVAAVRRVADGGSALDPLIV